MGFYADYYTDWWEEEYEDYREEQNARELTTELKNMYAVMSKDRKYGIVKTGREVDDEGVFKPVKFDNPTLFEYKSRAEDMIKRGSVSSCNGYRKFSADDVEIVEIKLSYC